MSNLNEVYISASTAEKLDLKFEIINEKPNIDMICNV